MIWRSTGLALTTIVLLLPISGLPVEVAAQSTEGSSSVQAVTAQDQIDEMIREVDRIQQESPGRDIGQMVREILQRSTSEEYRPGYLEGLLLFGDHYLTRELPDSALVPVREGLNEAEEIHYRVAFLRQAGLANRMKGNLLAATNYFQESLSLAQEGRSDRIEARLLYDLSVTHRQLGNRSSTFEFLYQALQRTDQVEDLPLRAAILLDTAELFRELENPSESFWYLDQALQIAGETGDRQLRIETLLSYGITYLTVGDLDQSDTYLQEVHGLASEQSEELVYADYYLGRLHLEQGQPVQARRYFFEALEHSDRLNFTEGRFYSAMGFGELERREEHFPEAAEWIGIALEAARQMHEASMVEQALERSYLVWREQGDSDRALHFLEALRSHTDEVQTLEHERARAEYETQFESRRREQENRLLKLRQAEQEARLQLQVGIGIVGMILLIVLGGVSVILYNNLRVRKQLNEQLRGKNRDISEKNDQLDHLNGVKDRLFAVIAHDLRGPLHSLQGLLSLLQQGKLTGERLAEMVRRVEQSLQNNAATMENLLVWARSQMSGIDLEREEFDPVDVAEEVLATFRVWGGEKGVSIQLHSKEVKGVFFGDPNVFRLVLRNLVSNAVKFSREGDEVRVVLSLGDGVLAVQVQDEGIGIEPGVAEKMFGEDHYTRKGTGSEKGSGLGLHLCREFLNKHGGAIWFDSEAGVGTTFHFTLPEDVDVEEEEAHADL